MRKGWVNHMRDGGFKLFMEDHRAYRLLTLIAYRAKRIDDDNEFDTADLEINQAFIGDYEKIGLTRGEYRSAQKKLTRYRLAIFKPTPKGTIATLISRHAMDINSDQSLTSIKPANLSMKIDELQPSKNQLQPKQKPLTRKEEVKRITTTTQSVDVLYPCLTECMDLINDDKQGLMQYSEDRVILALEWAQTAIINTTLIQTLHWHCRGKIPPKPALSKGSQHQREAWQFNAFLEEQGYHDLHKLNYEAIPKNYCHVILGMGKTTITLEQSIESLLNDFSEAKKEILKRN
ncbi:MAG: hypothetical protein K2Y01_08180 [Rhabdochlamydiaceae bacterium]|nr:hypothetical protein [Rhabdochlamydiaceae bacterium]